MEEPFIGEIFLVAFNYAPEKFAPCDGQLLQISQYQQLFNLIGTTYGGNGIDNFAVPNLQGSIPLGLNPADNASVLGARNGDAAKQITANSVSNHTHTVVTGAHVQMKTGTNADTNLAADAYLVPSDTPRYSDNADDKMFALDVDDLANPQGASFTEPNVTTNELLTNMMPYLSLNYVIALDGIYPSSNSSKSEQKVGDVIMTAFSVVPDAYLPCDGRVLNGSDYPALFSLLSRIYGGNGYSTFAIPDMRGKVPVAAGPGAGLTERIIGQAGGKKEVTITADNLPPHTHNVRETLLSIPAGDNNDTHSPVGAFTGISTSGNMYSKTAGSGVSADLRAVLTVDNGTPAPPVSNLQPSLTINFLITTLGLFPQRD